MTLQELGAQRGTDKGDSAHSFAGVSYLDAYTQYLEPIREKVRTVLELGIARGASLKMWRDYFPNAHVWGIDVDPGANLDYGSRVHPVIGSQDDPAVVAQVAPGEEFDLVVDDGSHLVDHLVASFRLIWPRVRSGGFYVMEDLTGSWNHDLNSIRNLWPGMTYNRPDTNYVNDRRKMQALLDEKIAAMDGLQGDMRFCHFWPMQIFFKKV